MASRQEDIPALEPGSSSGLFGALSLPIGLPRHNMCHDEQMDIPIHSPPEDFGANILWTDPIIPKHRFRKTAEENVTSGQMMTAERLEPTRSPVPVLKSKASSFMSSLAIKQTQENLQTFEHRAGLTDTGYTPHKGLSAEETRFHRLADGTQSKLRMTIGDFKDDRLTTSAQSTPSGTPCVTPSVTPSVTPTVTPCVSPLASPAVVRRSWFQRNTVPFLTAGESSSVSPTADMGGNQGGEDRWSFFGTRSVVQKSPTHPGSEPNTGFSLQSYFGLQKSSTIAGTGGQDSLRVGDTASFMPPKIEISGVDPKQVPTRPHKLKPRDMNVLTPSSF
ncbi:putative monooxygenase p33MONOX isoform X2 [Corythoichthys intestinalis]|uniref:putative monooxygenase p33MONOX isoform X2 n=1 Tax=Corythoichthys intestinalis TaxID=161448 RepID=UPI0025A4DC44|nr:putative monooxygenase p33MONOX isoform X2 [Corythoichthys intestinalis]XP_061792636.1 putative monooxygenase p33MONOX [Nerophis lumbriciformis]